jgi:hypothetical protein
MTERSNEPFLTQEDCDELAEQMSTKYRIALQDRRFQIQASIKGRGVFVTVLFSNADQSYYYPVEARILYGKEEMKAREAALFLIDYIDTYFEEYLLEEDEQLYLPIDWSDHQYEAVEFQVRGQILNRKLEQLADEWLKRTEGLTELSASAPAKT